MKLEAISSGLACKAVVLKFAIFSIVSSLAFLLAPGVAAAGQAWTPSTALSGQWEVVELDVAQEPAVMVDGKQCVVYRSVWKNSDTVVTRRRTDCGDPAAAATLVFEIRLLVPNLDSPPLFGENRDFEFDAPVPEGDGFGRAWVQDGQGQALIVQCGKLPVARCRAVGVDLSESLSAALPGEVGTLGASFTGKLARTALFSVPTLMYVLLVAFPGAVRWLSRSRFTVPSSSYRWVNVTARSRSLKRRSIVWGAAVGVRRFCIAFFALLLGAFATEPSLIAVLLLSVMVIMVYLATLTIKKTVDPVFLDASRNARFGRGAGGLAGIAVYLLAAALAVALTVAYFCVVLVLSLSGQSEYFAQAVTEIYRLKLEDGTASVRESITYLILSLSDSLVLLVVVLAMGLSAVVSLNRLSRALIARNAQEVLSGDGRAPILYLRNFDDDKVKLAASRVSRRGLLGRLSPLRRRRFEELISWRLAQFGPLIAVSDPRRRLGRLGAAKMNLPGDNWLDVVKEYAEDSLAVVVSAAPREVRRGLQCELHFLGTELRHRRIMLILPPLRRRKVLAGWNTFLHATQQYGLFQDLKYINPTGAAQVLIHVPKEGWFAWGAPSHSEWSYALSITLALRFAVERWNKVDHESSSSSLNDTASVNQN